MKLDILAISPHPDDAEIFCGGTLSLASSLGQKVGLVDLTQGEMGSRGNVKLRQLEAKNASKILKLKYRGNLSLPDAGINSKNKDHIAALIKVIRKYKPSIILTPYWKERHVDHIETSKLADKAIFLAGLRKYQAELGDSHTTRQVLYYQMRYAFKPSFVVDITKNYEKKLKAIYAHQSQLGKAKASEKGIKTLVGSPLAITSIQARDEYYGAMIGIKYGEPFLMKNTIALKDPVKHFSSYPELGALLFA